VGLYTKKETGAIGVVTLENCQAIGNGYDVNGKDTGGDGNGYKLGDDTASVPHILINCVAKNNKKHGFTGNGNPAKIVLQTAPVRVTEENCLTDLTMQYLNNNLKFDAQKRCLEMRHLFLSSPNFYR